MDNIRLFLIMALGFLSLLVWEAWQEDYVISKTKPNEVFSENKINSNVSVDDAPEIPLVVSIDESIKSETALPDKSKIFAGNRVVKIETDTLELVVDLQGGSIVDAKLKKYPASTKTPKIKYHLMSQRPEDYFI